MASLNDGTERGEVYKVIVSRVQEQEVEVEIQEDGEDLDQVVWEYVDSGDWTTVTREIEVITPVTCAGEV